MDGKASPGQPFFPIPFLIVPLGLLWRLLADFEPFQRWWTRKIAVPDMPRWYIMLVAIGGGGAGGLAFAALSWPTLGSARRWGPLLALSLGPLAGLVWLSVWKPRLKDSDYDDNMSSAPSRSRAREILLENTAATEAFGRRLGNLLFPNAVVALVGPLGAGKTHLTRAVAEGLGIANPAAVTSPTFTLVHEYPARLPIFHFDAYRLNGPNEFLDLGVNEYYEAGGVCLIEWADKVEAALPLERLTIRLTPVDEQRRRAEVVGTGETYHVLTSSLASATA
jgi:tRNA threonylcarbamoyladenosine biosynthesis protein TsaE